MKKDACTLEKTTFRDYLWALKGIRIPVLFLLIIFASSMLSAYAGMSISMFTGDMVDAQGNVPTAQLVRYSVNYALLGVAAAISVIASAHASERVNFALRSKLWRKIMYTTQRSYDSDCGESLVSRVTTDCDFSSRLLTIFVEILGLLVSLGLYVGKMFRLNVKLACAMMILIPVSVLFGWGYARLRFVIAQKTQAMLAGTTTYLVERTNGLSLIKTANTQQDETQKGLEHFDAQYKTQVKTGLLNIFYVSMQHLFSILSLLIPFLIGAKLVNDHVIRAGVVIAFYTMATTVGVSATNLINSAGSIRQANGALSRVIAVLKLPDERDAAGLSMDVPDQDISIQEVSFSYGSKAVLKNVTCTIPKNKVTAVIGSNGSGKSTLFRLIDRISEPDEGRLTFGDVDAREYDLHEWRRAFCLVAQESPLVEGTVRDNICYGCVRPVSDEELILVAKQARMYDFVSRLPDGFDTQVALGGANFSGGQRQCIAIARAMMNNPDYLLLDEATSNLDAQSERMVLEALKELMHGRTTVIIAHSLAAIRNADHVIVLHEGGVESEGAPAEILQKTDNYLSRVVCRRESR